MPPLEQKDAIQVLRPGLGSLGSALFDLLDDLLLPFGIGVVPDLGHLLPVLIELPGSSLLLSGLLILELSLDRFSWKNSLIEKS